MMDGLEFVINLLYLGRKLLYIRLRVSDVDLKKYFHVFDTCVCRCTHNMIDKDFVLLF